MSTQTVTKNTKWYVHVVIMFAIFIMFLFIPPISTITEMGMKVLGVTLALLYGWITIDLMWTSLLGFVLLQFTGYMKLLPALSAGIGNSTLMMIFILLAYASALQQIGASDVIAAWVMRQKIFIGHPMVLVFGLLFASAFKSLIGGGIAIIFIMWDVIRSICKANGMADDDTVKGFLMSMVLYLGFTGFILPWQNTIWLIGGFWQKGCGLEIPAMNVLYCGLIWMVLSIILCVLFAKYVLRFDFSKMLINEEIMAQYSGKKATKYQKAALIGLAIYIFCLLFANIFKNNVFADFINSIGVVGLSIIYMTVFAIWKDENGKPILDVVKCFRETPWAVVMLIAITIPLGDALQSSDTGVMGTISRWLMPLVSGMSPTVFIAICTVVLTILTQFLHNVICAAVFLPMLTPIVVQMGGNPYVFLFMLFIGLMSAYATPAASMFAGLVFGTKDISTKAAYLSGWLYTGMTIVILIALMPLWSMIMPSV